jgi:RNA 2',3'-cyclic 3'-phosphodiesterase
VGPIVRAFLAIDTGRPRSPGSDPVGGDAPAHLTLRFFGEVGPEVVDRVIAAVPGAAREVEPFDLALGGVGAFPSPDRPRVVWLGITEGNVEVRKLARSVDEHLAAVGLPAGSGEFVPHVTLLRVRTPRDRDRARALLDGAIAVPMAPAVRVAEVLLKASTLTPRGPEHRVVRSFALGAGAAASD